MPSLWTCTLECHHVLLLGSHIKRHPVFGSTELEHMLYDHIAPFLHPTYLAVARENGFDVLCPEVGVGAYCDRTGALAYDPLRKRLQLVESANAGADDVAAYSDKQKRFAICTRDAHYDSFVKVFDKSTMEVLLYVDIFDLCCKTMEVAYPGIEAATIEYVRYLEFDTEGRKLAIGLQALVGSYVYLSLYMFDITSGRLEWSYYDPVALSFDDVDFVWKVAWNQSGCLAVAAATHENPSCMAKILDAATGSVLNECFMIPEDLCIGRLNIAFNLAGDCIAISYGTAVAIGHAFQTLAIAEQDAGKFFHCFAFRNRFSLCAGSFVDSMPERMFVLELVDFVNGNAVRVDVMNLFPRISGLHSAQLACCSVSTVAVALSGEDEAKVMIVNLTLGQMLTCIKLDPSGGEVRSLLCVDRAAMQIKAISFARHVSCEIPGPTSETDLSLPDDNDFDSQSQLLNSGLGASYSALVNSSELEALRRESSNTVFTGNTECTDRDIAAIPILDSYCSSDLCTSLDAEMVVQNLEHMHTESPAHIEEELAEQIVTELFATHIQYTTELHTSASASLFNADDKRSNAETAMEASEIDSLSNPSIQTVFSAPAVGRLEHCLLPSSFVLTRDHGFVRAAQLQVGMHLVSLKQGSVVSRMIEFVARDRDCVCIIFERCQVTLTSSHCLSVYRKSAFHAMLATDLQEGDVLRTLTNSVIVQQVRLHTIASSVVEVELRDRDATMLVSDEGDGVEVYGALAPRLADNTIKVLQFNCFSKLRETLLGKPELDAIRRALEASGYSADLTTYELGPGKLLVPPEFAWPALLALRTWWRTGAQRRGGIGCRDVVVSRETEPIVRDAVAAHASRSMYVVQEHILDIPNIADCNRSGPSVAVTQSTNPETNPRKSKKRAWDDAL